MIFDIEPMSVFAKEVLWCLFKHGPTWDGNLPSKDGRKWLVKKGYAAQGDGWNWLTTDGVLLAIEIGLGRQKEKRQ